MSKILKSATRSALDASIADTKKQKVTEKENTFGFSRETTLSKVTVGGTGSNVDLSEASRNTKSNFNLKFSLKMPNT